MLPETPQLVTYRTELSPVRQAGSSIFLLTTVPFQESEAAPNRIMLSQDANCEEGKKEGGRKEKETLLFIHMH